MVWTDDPSYTSDFFDFSDTFDAFYVFDLDDALAVFESLDTEFLWDLIPDC